jgi:hypothetical protein
VGYNSVIALNLGDTMPEQTDLARGAAERAHGVHKTFVLQSNTASVESAHSVLRTIMLINGGAVVAILGFICVVADKHKLSTNDLHAIAGSLRWFAFGVFCTAVAFGAAFLTNCSTALGNAAKPLDWIHPYVHDCPTSNWCNVFRNVCAVSAILFGVVAIVAFGTGAGSIYSAIVKLSL